MILSLRSKIRRGGFSLLETLFAIVVIAIILIPIPKLLQSIADTAEAIAIKDALFSTTTKMMQLSLYRWDEHSKDEHNLSSSNKILDTTTNSFPRISDDNITRVSELENRIFFDPLEFNETQISASIPINFRDADEVNDTVLFDDIDDWNGTKLYYDVSRGDNMKTIDFALYFEVYYIEDNDSNFQNIDDSIVQIELNKTNINSPDRNLTSNLKLVRIWATQLNSDHPFKFHLDYISINTGESDYGQRIIY